MAAPVAVALVTHNGVRYLREQIESISNQSERPEAVYLVDDRSADSSVALARRLCRDGGLDCVLVPQPESSMRHQRQVYSRIAANFWAAFHAASKDFELVAFSDQDDIWLPDRTINQKSLISKTGALLAFGDGYLVNERGDRSSGLLSDAFPMPTEWEGMTTADRLAYAMRKPIVTGATVMAHRDFLTLCPEIPATWLHDRWASLVAIAAEATAYDPNPLIEYRIHSEQAVGNSNAATQIAKWLRQIKRPRSAFLRFHSLARQLAKPEFHGVLEGQSAALFILRSQLSRPVLGQPVITTPS
jgi:glycosyltransferase involved in cell wall biosynthesis